MKSVFAIVAAFAITGFLFYWLLASSERVEARLVVEPQKKEAVKRPADASKKTEKK